MDYHRLLEVWESAEIKETAAAVERETRRQAYSKLWFKYRAGRMKAVCHTDAAKSSQSLVKSICYPELFSFTSRQTETEWGCKHEKAARQRYIKAQEKTHKLFCRRQWTCDKPPLVVHWRICIGILLCKCCGKGSYIRDKISPLLSRRETVAAFRDSRFFLQHNSNGSLHLDLNHAYYYQVQAQLFVTDVEYCDFCVCTMCVLPELLGKWYTQPTTSTNGCH